MRRSKLNELYKTYTNSFTGSSTPITEINSDEIKEIVNKRCTENNLSKLHKIYGFENGCPVCTNNYTNKNWIVLHPCGHLLCNDCLEGLNTIVQDDGIPRKCPMCRKRCKWIGPREDNLLRTPSSYGGGYIRPSTPIFGPVTPSRRFQIEEEEEIEEELLPSLPPLLIVEEEKKENMQEKVKAEISTISTQIENTSRIIGNLSIKARDLENVNIGIDLVIVMDVSGSMSPVSNDCISILKESISSLTRLDRLSIIVFDSSARQLFALQPMTNEIKSECRNKVESCFTGGSTNFQSAIKLLIKVKENGMISDRPFKIIFLSDGQPDSGKDGMDLIKDIYNGDYLPELFACTFGRNVKADILQRFLLEGGMHYYRHIPDVSGFKTLISEIGLDKNIEVGRNIRIKLQNIIPETSLTTKKENNKIVIEIDRIKTGEILSIPLLYGESSHKIEVEYQDLETNVKNLEINEIEVQGDFIKNHFWYRRIVKMIKDINIETENGLEKLSNISFLSSPDKLGSFYEEIKGLITEARNMLTIHTQGFHHYNTYTSSVQRTVSYSSPTVQRFYRSSTPI